MNPVNPSGGPFRPLNHQQFMRLFLESERELMRYIMALLPDVVSARDVLQETAIALWQAIGKYDPSRPFVPWACRFALNEVRQHMRAERRRRLFDADVAALLDEQRQRDASLFDRRREHLRDCLGRLSASQRALIRGYYFDEEAIAALAERTGSGAEAVYKSLQRIRQTLHLCISRKLQA